LTDAAETIDSPGSDGAPLGQVAVYCLAIISIAAAVLHFAIAADNFAAHWLFSLVTLATSWVQLGWAIMATIRPSRRLLQAGALLNSVIFAVYLAAHAAGGAFGNGLGAALDAVLAVGCAWLLSAKPARLQVPRQRLVVASAATAAMTAALLGVALGTAGPAAKATPNSSANPATAAGGSGMPGMAMPDPAASAIKLANSTPAGDITMPSPDMQVMTGMRMASSVPCTALPSPAQQKAAVSFVDTSWQAAKKYQSLAVARAAGYRPITPSGAAVVHYLNAAYYRATVDGGPVLNTVDPQSLVYANTPKGAVLVAAMYITSPGGPTPQPGGCLTQWHVHTNLCLTPGLGVVGEVGPNSGGCPPGSVNRVTPAMIHVWFVPIPGGPTAIDAPDQQVVQAAEQVPAPPNGTA
jgi:hypothetical protein